MDLEWVTCSSEYDGCFSLRRYRSYTHLAVG